jgi:hypothetical protein
MQEVFILKQAKELRQEHKRMGAEKMLYLLSDVLLEHGIKYGRDKFYNLLGEHGLLIKRKGRSKRTTNSNHFYRKDALSFIRCVARARDKIWKR